MSEANGVLKDYNPLQPRMHGKFIPKHAAVPIFTPAFGGQAAPPPPAPPRPAADPLAALLGAMVVHAVESAAAERDMVPGLRALVKLLRDRVALARALKRPRAAVEKAYWAAEERAWNPAVHPRDDRNRYVSRDLVQDARDDPTLAAELRDRVTRPREREKLERALAGRAEVGRTKLGTGRYLKRTRARLGAGALARVEALRRHFALYGATPGELLQLADVLPHLPAGELAATARAAEAVGRGAGRAEAVAALAALARGQSDCGPDDPLEPTRPVRPDPVPPGCCDEPPPVEGPWPAPFPPAAPPAPAAVTLRRRGKGYAVEAADARRAAAAGVPSEIGVAELGVCLGRLLAAGYRVTVAE